MGFVRFALAIVVLLSHAGYGATTIGALASVQAFFVLSGIYMAAVFRTRYSKLEHGAQLFYFNRVLRLWPTYLVLLVLTALAFLALGRPATGDLKLFDLFRDLASNGLTRTDGLMLTLSVVMFGQDVASVVEPLHYLLPVRQSWSIATELLFYLCVPLIFRMKFYQVFFGAFAMLMLLKVALLGVDWRLSYFFPLGNFGYFSLGFGLYLLVTKFQAAEVLRRLRPAGPLIVIAIIALTVSFGEASFERGGIAHHLAYIGLFSILAILLFVCPANSLDGFFGNLSYGIYLNHLLVLAVVQILGIQGWHVPVVTIAGSVGLAALLEKVVQKPIDRIRYRRTMLQSTPQS